MMSSSKGWELMAGDSGRARAVLQTRLYAGSVRSPGDSSRPHVTERIWR